MNKPHAPNSWEGRAIKNMMAGFTDFPTLKERGPIVLTHGKGARVYDVAGRDYLDANSGLWNVVCGFDHEGMMEAMVEQTRRYQLAHAFSNAGEAATSLELLDSVETWRTARLPKTSQAR